MNIRITRPTVIALAMAAFYILSWRNQAIAPTTSQFDATPFNIVSPKNNTFPLPLHIPNCRKW